MSFSLYRNVTPANVVAIRQVLLPDEVDTPKPKTQLELKKQAGMPINVNLLPGPQRRNTSTLQRATCRIGNDQWQYDNGDLVLAVVCRRKWAPPNVDRQRFAVIVSIRHEAPMLDLYTHVQQRTHVYQRVRARA